MKTNTLETPLQSGVLDLWDYVNDLERAVAELTRQRDEALSALEKASSAVSSGYARKRLHGHAR